MSNQPKRRALGRGLSALLPASEGRPSPANREPKRYFRAPIEEIYPNPEQPRKRFSEEAIEELAQSITAHGVIQPLIVRVRKEGGFYLIAGERRWRASQRAGIPDIPVVVQDVTGRDAFERALVENLQRADLNAIEEAEAYSRLITQYNYTQEQVAERVGKDRSTVANSLRLLRLPASVRSLVEDGKLTMGHARALLALESVDEIEAVARAVVGKALSVRATEALIREKQRGTPAQPAVAPAQKSASVRDLENRLTKALGSQVAVSEDKKGKGGRIEIKYADLDDLDRLLAKLLNR